MSLLGGGLCGLAGANAILGVQHVLLSNFSPGWGYTAIAVALLGGLMPFGMLFAGDAVRRARDRRDQHAVRGGRADLASAG